MSIFWKNQFNHKRIKNRKLSRVGAVIEIAPGWQRRGTRCTIAHEGTATQQLGRKRWQARMTQIRNGVGCARDICCICAMRFARKVGGWDLTVRATIDGSRASVATAMHYTLAHGGVLIEGPGGSLPSAGGRSAFSGLLSISVSV